MSTRAQPRPLHRPSERTSGMLVRARDGRARVGIQDGLVNTRLETERSTEVWVSNPSLSGLSGLFVAFVSEFPDEQFYAHELRSQCAGKNPPRAEPELEDGSKCGTSTRSPQAIIRTRSNGPA